MLLFLLQTLRVPYPLVRRNALTCVTLCSVGVFAAHAPPLFPRQPSLVQHYLVNMKSVAVAAFLALAATANGFVTTPAMTGVARTSTVATGSKSAFMSRPVAKTQVASTGALKMSTSMNDAQQPTLEQVSGPSFSPTRAAECSGGDFMLTTAASMKCYSGTMVGHRDTSCPYVCALRTLLYRRSFLTGAPNLPQIAVAVVRRAQAPVYADRHVRSMQGDRVQDPHRVV